MVANMWTGVFNAVATVTVIALIAGLALRMASSRLPADTDSLIDELNALLPQTQCAQCGYPGCRPYAKAIVESDEAINICPPGGQATVDKLATLLGKESLPVLEVEAATSVNAVAIIDEEQCIGCTHCRTACPVDANVGAHQLMHTIIASECTGCELCLPPCPVDCISMVRAT